MKKRMIALVALLLCCVMLMTGCVSTEGLKKVPQGQRPEGKFVFADAEPQFPSDSSVKNQLMMISTQIKAAKDIDEQRELYEEFLYNAYVYVIGPYNFTHYLAQDGRSMTVYYDNMINHMTTLLSEWEPSAWTAIGEAPWGAQLKSEYANRICTPDSIRNVYPTGDETVASQLQNMYTARDELAKGIADGFAESDKETLLDDLFAARETLANTLMYDSYPDYVVEKRDKMPYDLESLLKLAQLIKEHLAPAVKAAKLATVLNLSAQQWNDKLPTLAQRFDAYEEDLLYALNSGAYVVESTEEAESRHFAYQLYQYDLSAGKAVIAKDEDAALHVLHGLALEARNMALEQEQWSMSALQLQDSIHEGAFAGMCINELDALGVEAEAAKAELTYLMAKDVCRAAMELELLVELYRNPVMAQVDRDQLIADLSAAYGVEDMDGILEQSEDVLMGTLGCAGRMLGGLYGLTLHEMDNADPAKAEEVLTATLSVYNADNPIAVGYAAGLNNPYSTDGIKAVAELLK